MRFQVQINSAVYTGLMPLADVKEYLRFDGTDQDTVLATIIEGSINLAESITSQSFGTKTITAEYSKVYPRRRYRLPYGYHRDILTVNAIALDGTATLLTEGTDYHITGLNVKSVAIISPNCDVSYRVNYTAGPLDPATVVNGVKAQIYKIIADYFENRENSTDASNNMIHQNATQGLTQYRLR